MIRCVKDVVDDENMYERSRVGRDNEAKVRQFVFGVSLFAKLGAARKLYCVYITGNHRKYRMSRSTLSGGDRREDSRASELRTKMGI